MSEGKVEFKAPGTCVIDANQAGDSEWEAAPEKKQEVEVKRAQAIVFTSTPPAGAVVGGSAYEVVAEAAPSKLPVRISVDASSSSVCEVRGGASNSPATVSFIGAGTCTIDADQEGNPEYEAAPQKQQSFAVAAAPVITIVPGPAPSPKPPPSPAPAPPLSTGNSNFKAGLSTFEPKTGRVIFYETISDSGTFTWLLTVPNGKFGAFASGKKCSAGLVRLSGRCRPSRVIFAMGSASVPAGVVIFKLRPSPNALKALKNALKLSRGMLVTATFTFQSSRGGTPVTHTQTLRVKLKLK
jgi:hypothetical protein